MTDTSETTNSNARESRGVLAVVGLGSPAGGLDAYEEFFSNMPDDSGLAFVIITHQQPTHQRRLIELLQRVTAMSVREVSTSAVIEPNSVYVPAPGALLDIKSGELVAQRNERYHLPIDHFFRSLAEAYEERAIGVIMSGGGADGSLGIQEIKASLGMVIAQTEASAEYRSAPHCALATAVVDYELEVKDMPATLLAYVKGLAEMLEKARPNGDDDLDALVGLLFERAGHDFRNYKRTTLRRRVERRLDVHSVSLQDYVRLLRDDQTEVDKLFNELLIGVTSFFRDPEAWSALAEKLAALLAEKPDDYVFRAWVPGCSTGEEAYTLAIVIREALEAASRDLGVQIFATDLDERAIHVARSGACTLGITSDVAPQRLHRFFSKTHDVYRVKKEIREMVVFATQNVIADPPFTKLDLVSCRNLLIYLDGSLQRRLIPTFHYALKPSGLLLLGSSESIGSFSELFKAEDKKWKIFRRKEVVTRLYTADFPAVGFGLGKRGSPSGNQVVATQSTTDRSIEKALLAELVPPTVVVRERGDVVHVHGRTGKFLEVAPGAQSTTNVHHMARPGLEVGLPAALRQAKKTGKEVVMRGLPVLANSGRISVDLRVKRLVEPESLAGLYRITFEQARAPDSDGTVPPHLEHKELDKLERELQHSKESHQGALEELEVANEELQSANEELETSKEEMQSLNEELQTVNSELREKLDELSEANNDMRNILNATEIATVFLDNELRIKRFTSQARQVIHLIPSDVGRPIGDLVSSLRYDRLVDDAAEVFRTLSFKEIEVESDGGETYLLRILPYRTTENLIDGLVLTFVDVSELRQLRTEHGRLLDSLERAPVCVFAQDRQSRIIWGVGQLLGRPASDFIGKADPDLFDEGDRAVLESIRRSVVKGEASRCKVHPTLDDGDRRTLDLYIEPRRGGDREITGFTTVAMDRGEGPSGAT